MNVYHTSCNNYMKFKTDCQIETCTAKYDIMGQRKTVIGHFQML